MDCDRQPLVQVTDRKHNADGALGAGTRTPDTSLQVAKSCATEDRPSLLSYIKRLHNPDSFCSN